MKVVALEISDILDTREDGVQVLLTESGKTPWLPRGEVQFAPGRVIVPEWLAKKIMEGGCREQKKE